jgi:amino acid permease
MKKATSLSVATTTIFYMLCGCMGYAAFGDKSPDNLLTGFGFYEPFWLLDVANVAIVVHLVGAYQVFCQPIFAFVERRANATWPNSAFIANELKVGPFALSLFRLTWRSAFVCLTTVVAMLLPFFGNVVGLLGAVSFWPLTVFFPVEMYIKQRRVLWGRHQMDLPPDAQRHLPRRLPRRRRGLHRRHCRRAQGLPPVQRITQRSMIHLDNTLM